MGFFQDLAIQYSIPLWLIFIAVGWSLFWKAIALWKSARSNHIIWFVAFLIVHTLGILEILYIFLFSKIKLEEYKTQKRKRPRKRKTRKRR